MDSLRRTVRRSSLVATLVLGLLVPASLAAEVVVKNDSYFTGGSAYIVGDFIPGEHAGARLTSPCDGTIVAVQVAWLTEDPGYPPSLERAIHVYEGSTFPTPGAELAYLEAPLLTSGYINEFRYLDEAGTIPLSIPVNMGEQFYVTLEFEEATHIADGTPSVIRDLSGCQSGKNVIYAIPGDWINFCLFTTGDLVIRAVVDCGELPGACCLPSGACEYVTPTQCGEVGGEFQEVGQSCAAAECPQPLGACCFESTGGCLNMTMPNCDLAGGAWGGPDTSCATYVCFPSGACCLADGTCADEQSPTGCSALDGTFMGDGSACAGVECPAPAGACCIAVTGGCLLLTADDCSVVGGYWAGWPTDCSDANQNGTADACERGDVNCDGAVDAFDVDPFVLALTDASGYEALYPECYLANADINRDGAVNAFDIDAFVTLLVGG